MGDYKMFVNKLDNKGLDDLTRMMQNIINQALSSKAPKVKKMYLNNQTKWFNFMKRNNITDYFNEVSMIAFFFRNSNMIISQEPSGWCTPASTHGIS
mgnify:CR=1 FL=1